MFLQPIHARLGGNERNWIFIGAPGWKQDGDGVICPPVWSYPNFDPDPTQVPNHYAHELAREDYAFLDTEPLDDTDVAVDYRCPYGSVLNGGIVFRAVDSRRFYVVDLIELGRKGQAYEVGLWVQLASGYRRLLACALAPHSVIPDRIVQGGARTRQQWDHSSADWIRLRVQATGTFIRVSVDGRILFELRDDSCRAGRVGLVARGAVSFRDLRVQGGADGGEPWTTHEGELPRFFLPGGEQPVGFNAYPVVCRTPAGDTLVAWAHDPSRSGERPGAGIPSVVLTRSADEGRTWSVPAALFSRPCHHAVPTSLYAHADGSLTGLVSFAADPETAAVALVLRSEDGGDTWAEAGEFQVAGRPQCEAGPEDRASPGKQADGVPPASTGGICSAKPGPRPGFAS